MSLSVVSVRAWGGVTVFLGTSSPLDRAGGMLSSDLELGLVHQADTLKHPTPIFSHCVALYF